MELRRRFIFRGNAAAIGGRIVRPNRRRDRLEHGQFADGGRRPLDIARPGTTRFGDLVSFGAAATSAEGLFDDVKQQIELTLGTRRRGRLDDDHEA